MPNFSTQERRAAILRLIDRQNSVSVSELSRMFGISEVSIRKDLKTMQRANLLMRNRGGAMRIPVADNTSDMPLDTKIYENIREKSGIGKLAASMICDGDTVMLDSGTTTLEIAKNLKWFNRLTIVTNAINIALEIQKYNRFNTILLGGHIRNTSLSVVGPVAEQNVRSFYCDKLFLGVDSFSMTDGISTPNIEEANLNSYGMPIELWQSARGITRNWQSLGDIQPYMLNFLENHDEPRFASDFFGKKAENSVAPLTVALYLNRSPFMVYAGEEMGERGMEQEGFSGRDGRTSIFDWWGVSSLQALRKIIAAGIYKSDSPWPEEFSRYESFFRKFTDMVRFAASDDAVRKGMTYDLCYCNTNSDGFNIDRHFAFLRDHLDETLLFVANFSTQEARMKLKIPPHAFEWLELESTPAINPDTPIEVTVPPMDGIMICLSQNNG